MVNNEDFGLALNLMATFGCFVLKEEGNKFQTT